MNLGFINPLSTRSTNETMQYAFTEGAESGNTQAILSLSLGRLSQVYAILTVGWELDRETGMGPCNGIPQLS